jgi:predicted MFS family arabinose efflux permease
MNLQLGDDVRQYAVVTAAYWSFTLTDGALRMLVLLYFHQLGYTAIELALLFVLYELFGIVTNLVGGWAGARFGLNRTLYAGMLLQIVALLLLTVPAAWLSLPYVMLAQALSGIAKDLSKMSAKSSVKLLVPAAQSGRLFRWVALLTGSKNALKGAGFFLGGLLLAAVGFRSAMVSMAVWIAVFLIAALLLLRGDLGRTSARPPFTDAFSRSRSVNLLSGARFFLFGARDIWFVVALPVFLQSVLGYSFTQVGTFMALWVIGYGAVQSVAPRLVRAGETRADQRGRAVAASWTAALALLPAMMAALLFAGVDPAPVLFGGLGLFAVVFAVNSSVHSWLILEYARADGASMDVGFYYMANAGGRLVGTVLSGVLFQLFGMTGCLLGSALFVAISATAMVLPKRPGQLRRSGLAGSR